MPAALPKRILFASPWWHADIVNGVLRHAAARGWHVDLQTCLSGHLPRRWTGHGIITQFGSDRDQFLRLLEQTGCPAVSLNNNDPDIPIPRVSTDGKLAGRLAAEHLLERGFRSFAFYAHGLMGRSRRIRYEAFDAALRAAGHRAEAVLWDERAQEYDQSWLRRQQWLADRLADLPMPLGVFAFNDQGAVEVIEACMSAGIVIPDQVAVLGMLNMDIFRHSTTVGLSSITYDFDRMTGLACDLLGRMMEGEPGPPADQPILLPPTGIAVRQSTDTLAAHSPAVARAVRFMIDHQAEPISIDAIVAAAGGSRAALFNAFKADMSQPPGQVLARIRVERAKRLLTTTRHKVAAIAEACGFGNSVNLHRTFKQHTGQSPSDYRRAHAGG